MKRITDVVVLVIGMLWLVSYGLEEVLKEKPNLHPLGLFLLSLPLGYIYGRWRRGR